MENDNATHGFSVDELIQNIMDGILSDKDKFDTGVAQLVKDHLGEQRIQTIAGNNLADAIIQLAKTRSQELEK